MSNQTPPQLIGEIKEVFPQSKTKENAVHAGLFQLLLLLNHFTWFQRNKLLTYLNNNWLTVVEPMATWDAQEDLP